LYKCVIPFAILAHWKNYNYTFSALGQVDVVIIFRAFILILVYVDYAVSEEDSVSIFALNLYLISLTVKYKLMKVEEDRLRE
jgi:hypothetical protein